MKKADLFFNVLRLPMDYLMLLVAGITTYVLRTHILSAFRPVLFQFNLPLIRYLTLVGGVSLLFLIAYALAGLYSMRTRMSSTAETARIAVASSAGIMLVIIYIFLQQTLFNSRFLVLGAWLFAIFFVSLGRLIVRWLQKYLVTKYNFGTHRLVVIGGDELTGHIVKAVESNPALGYRLVARLNEPDMPKLIAYCLQGIDEVILADAHYPEEKIADIVDLCQEYHVIFKFVPSLSHMLTRHFDMEVFDNIPLIEIKRTPLDGWGRVAKRILDIIAGGVGLLICSPVFLIIALAIKLDTRGPVLVKLKRVSRNKKFDLYKFRSMIAVDPDGSADSLKSELIGLNERNDGPLFKIKNDPRITKVGRLIRRTRLDELPQFWNVLKGDMSLVGPRPHQPDEIARYERHHKKILGIKAGATGMAQVSGASDLPFEEEVRLDTYYMENWSLWLDIKLAFKTALKMLNDHTAV